MQKLSFIILLVLYSGLLQAQYSDLTEPISEIGSQLPEITTNDFSWKLVFNDEFSDPLYLNTKKWKVYGAKEPFPRRDGFWTADAVAPDGAGNLKMSTYQDADSNYFDGCIYTEDIFETTYGYFEIRTQLHRSEGHWPAFWLYSGDVFKLGKGGIDGAEIDIFEKFKTNRRVAHNIHWDGYSESHQAEGMKSRHRKIMKGFHTFGLWWSPDFYRFYVDGKEVWQTKAGGVCEVPLHLLVSDEVGKHARMRSIKKADLPDYWLVDHIRVYKLQPQ
ncbi:MAG: glycoside hydrolase family 16 protein [Bacteroidetes bacterium]|nr:glycoside hydrolase family 16 protein [Bacteroidota bacterium]